MVKRFEPNENQIDPIEAVKDENDGAVHIDENRNNANKRDVIDNDADDVEGDGDDDDGDDEGDDDGGVDDSELGIEDDDGDVANGHSVNDE